MCPPTRLPHPWDSPGKNTGVGCHFLLQCMTVKSESEVAQSCLTLRDPMDCSPLGSPIPGITKARTLEWVAISFSNAWKWKVKMKSLSRVWLFTIPWTAVYQAPLSMGIWHVPRCTFKIKIKTFLHHNEFHFLVQSQKISSGNTSFCFFLTEQVGPETFLCQDFTKLNSFPKLHFQIYTKIQKKANQSI